MSDSEEPEYVAGNGVEISGDWTLYTAKQTGEQTDGDTLTVPPPDEADGTTLDLKWSHGPVSYKGWVNIDTFDMKVLPTISGVKVGVFSANLTDRFALRLHLSKTGGEVKIYLYKGNQVKTNIFLPGSGTPHNGDFQLLAW